MFDFLDKGEISLKDVQKAIKDLPLPEKIKSIAIYKRYKAIRAVQQEMKQKVKALEKKYLLMDTPILDNIAKIVGGQKPIEGKELHDLDKYLTEEEKAHVDEHRQARKIQNYWFKVLSNSGLIKEKIGENDEPLLKAIENIHVTDQEGTDNFTIHFSFAKNEIIANDQLWKKFYVEKDEPVKCESNEIEWKNKNLTMKEIKKKQKNKKTGQMRVITKTAKSKSFFNFFSTIQKVDDKDIEMNEEQLKRRENLEDDFQIGGVIVDEVLPYSLEYYLGIEHDDGEDSENDEDDEDDDDDEPKKKDKSKSKSKSKDSKGKKGNAKAAEKPQCKTQ